MVGLGQVGRFGPVCPHVATTTKTPPPAFYSRVAQLVPGFGPLQRIPIIVDPSFETDLNTVDDGKPGGFRSLPKPRNAVEAVMIGHSKGLISQFDCILNQILRMRGPVEKGEIGMAVQFGVTIHPLHYIEHMFDPSKAGNYSSHIEVKQT